MCVAKLELFRIWSHLWRQATSIGYFHRHIPNPSISDDFRGTDEAGQSDCVLDEAMEMPSFFVSCLARDRIKTCVVRMTRHYELHTVWSVCFHRLTIGWPMEDRRPKSMEQSMHGLCDWPVFYMLPMARLAGLTRASWSTGTKVGPTIFCIAALGLMMVVYKRWIDFVRQ